MTAGSAPLRGVAPEKMLAVLRAALGITFVIGGIKIAFPPDAAALATSYIDPAAGWISPFFAEQITSRLGFEIATFLRVQGLVEIALGALMIVGVAWWLLYIVPVNVVGKWFFPGLRPGPCPPGGAVGSPPYAPS